MTNLTRDYLTDGYTSYTYTSRNAEKYVGVLFKVDAKLVVAFRDDKSGAYYVFNPPSHYSPPNCQIFGRNAWILDYAVNRSGGSVVPQQLWLPQGQGDRRRYVEQAQLHMPVFFFNMDGSMGVPVMNAAVGQVQLLRGRYLPPQLADRTTIKIRICVCTRSLPAHPHHLPYVSQWPGYVPSEHQVQMRDQTSGKSPITFDKFVKHVGSRVKQFLLVRLSQMWR